MPRSHVGIFTMNPHWTLSLCFHKFHCVWVHLLWFRNCMKLGAKQRELVQLLQKFVARIHVRIFHNEFTQSAPLDPKLMFCVLHSVWMHLGLFRNCMKLGAKQSELVQLMQKLVPRSHIGIFRNECPVGPQTNVSVCFTIFQCIWDHFVTA